MEIWKHVKGYEGLYKVSNTGRILSLRNGKFIAKNYTKLGYNRVTLRDKYGRAKTYETHRLVAKAFIPKIEGKDYVDHIDGNPRNNYVKNLRWCTQKENLNFPIAKKNRERAMSKFKEKILMLDKDNNIIREFNGVNEAMRETGIKTICGCLATKKYVARTKEGYTFVYYNSIELPVLALILG